MSLYIFFALILVACNGSPAGRSEPGLNLEISRELVSDGDFVFVAGDRGEYTRRIADAAAKKYLPGNGSADVLELVLHTRLREWEDMSPGFISKRYEIHIEGGLVHRNSGQVGTLEGRLEYRRSRFRPAVSDEAAQYEEWDRDFVDWSAGKIVEALTF